MFTVGPASSSTCHGFIILASSPPVNRAGCFCSFSMSNTAWHTYNISDLRAALGLKDGEKAILELENVKVEI